MGNISNSILRSSPEFPSDALRSIPRVIGIESLTEQGVRRRDLELFFSPQESASRAKVPRDVTRALVQCAVPQSQRLLRLVAFGLACPALQLLQRCMIFDALIQRRLPPGSVPEMCLHVRQVCNFGHGTTTLHLFCGICELLH